MRAIKRVFKCSKVTISDSATNEVIDEMFLNGEVTRKRVMLERMREDKQVEGIIIGIEDMEETRIMSGEDFIKYSTLIEEPKELEDEEQEDED